MKKIVFCCGGTGGHVYPAIALAQALRERASVAFLVSSDREDFKIVTRYHYAFTVLGPYKGRILAPFWRSFTALRKQCPDALICTGGAQTFWAGLAAKLLKIPLYLMEQNSIPGRTNKVLAYLANRIFISFEESRAHFYCPQKCEWIGNPVRKHFNPDPCSYALRELELASGPVVLVFGGSQGATALNDVIRLQAQAWMESHYTVLHIAGSAYYAKHYTESPFSVLKNERGEAKLITMPYCEEMDYLYNKADIVISRSGATTIAELIHFSKPAILIPFPTSKDQHQDENARLFCADHIGFLCPESDLSIDKLLTSLDTLLKVPKSRKSASVVSEKLAKRLIDSLS